MTFADRDEFGRKAVAERLKKLLENEHLDISPTIIDGQWGSGKTEFTHKLINALKASGGQTLYVDAFRDDHHGDPVLMLLSAFATILPEGENRDGFIKKIIPGARLLGKTAIKATIAHVLRIDADDVEDTLQDGINEGIDAVTDSLLKDQSKAEETITALKCILKETTKEQRLYLFIDELDRCRPDFALDVLELIKHEKNAGGQV